LSLRRRTDSSQTSATLEVLQQAKKAEKRDSHSENDQRRCSCKAHTVLPYPASQLANLWLATLSARVGKVRREEKEGKRGRHGCKGAIDATCGSASIKHLWFSGKIGHCHLFKRRSCLAPGSIPGECIFCCFRLLCLLRFLFLFSHSPPLNTALSCSSLLHPSLPHSTLLDNPLPGPQKASDSHVRHEWQ
jgi:hypothetical protein